MSGSNVRAGMALSAVSAGALGMMLLFALEEMSGVLSPAGNGGPLTPLLGAVSAANNHVAFWVLTALYLFGAVFFSYLTFVSSGLREE